jgi:hypothetical protein
MRVDKPEEGWAPILFVVLVILALFFTLISLVYYGSAKDDYPMVCEPSGSYAASPGCASDLNQMTYSEVLVGVGFFFTGLSLYRVRRVKTKSSQPIFYIFGTFMLMLGLYALYWFL